MASKLLTKLRGSEDWEVCNVIKKEGLAVGMVEVQREIDQGFYDDHKIYPLEEFLEEGQKPRYEGHVVYGRLTEQGRARKESEPRAWLLDFYDQESGEPLSMPIS